MFVEFLLAAGAVVLIGGGAIALMGDSNREADWAINDRLRAEVDKLDLEWAAKCDADLAAVTARIRAGDLTARLGDWRIEVEPRCPDEARQLVPGLYSIVDFRNRRRHQSRIIAKTLVEKEIEDVLAARETRKREAMAAEQQAIWAKQAALAEARESERQRRITAPQPLPDDAGRNGIILGLRISDGGALAVPVTRLQHMLVVGASGSGKSVFVHQLVWQLVHTAPDVERVIIIDLKGGVEFARYLGHPRTRLMWEFSDLAAVLAEINTLMEQRESVMRDRNLQNWPGGRVFIVIDEYAEIQSEIDSAQTKNEKMLAQGIARNLVRIGRRARALGIVLVCALQKATTDAMDSALRANLNSRVCLRVNTRQFAASVLDGLENLPADPVALRPGRFIWYDASRGELDYAVACVAPGVTFGDG